MRLFWTDTLVSNGSTLNIAVQTPLVQRAWAELGRESLLEKQMEIVDYRERKCHLQNIKSIYIFHETNLEQLWSWMIMHNWLIMEYDFQKM